MTVDFAHLLCMELGESDDVYLSKLLPPVFARMLGCNRPVKLQVWQDQGQSSVNHCRGKLESFFTLGKAGSWGGEVGVLFLIIYCCAGDKVSRQKKWPSWFWRVTFSYGTQALFN